MYSLSLCLFLFHTLSPFTFSLSFFYCHACECSSQPPAVIPNALPQFHYDIAYYNRQSKLAKTPEGNSEAPRDRYGKPSHLPHAWWTLDDAALATMDKHYKDSGGLPLFGSSSFPLFMCDCHMPLCAGMGIPRKDQPTHFKPLPVENYSRNYRNS